jgi:tetratricopeptide (TPR) repeat protein
MMNDKNLKNYSKELKEIANLLFEKNKLEEALLFYKEAYAANRLDPEAKFMSKLTDIMTNEHKRLRSNAKFGYDLYQWEDYEAAISEFEKDTTSFEDQKMFWVQNYKLIYHLLAICYMKIGNKEKALENMKKFELLQFDKQKRQYVFPKNWRKKL